MLVREYRETVRPRFCFAYHLYLATHIRAGGVGGACVYALAAYREEERSSFLLSLGLVFIEPYLSCIVHIFFIIVHVSICIVEDILTVHSSFAAFLPPCERTPPRPRKKTAFTHGFVQLKLPGCPKKLPRWVSIFYPGRADSVPLCNSWLTRNYHI